jgi:hypothetical protein
MVWTVEIEGGVNVALPGQDVAAHRCWIPVGEVTVPSRTRRKSVLEQAAAELRLVASLDQPRMGVRIVDPRWVTEGDVAPVSRPAAEVTVRDA